MSDHERFGTRDLAYSRWHRTLGKELTYIDVDGCEYCYHCREPLALVETAMDIDQAFKTTTVMRRLAEKAVIPAYLVYYQVRITRFRVQQVVPQFGTIKVISPEEYARKLQEILDSHHCTRKAGGNADGKRLL